MTFTATLPSCYSSSSPANASLTCDDELDLSNFFPSQSLSSSSFIEFPLNDLFLPLAVDSTPARAEGSYVEEILDFFLDLSDPNHLVVSRSQGPMMDSSINVGLSSSINFGLSSSLPTSAASPAQCPPVPAPIKTPTGAVNLKRAAESSSPLSNVDEKVLMKRERNRLAAERCRARKVNMIDSLREECDKLKAERNSLIQENMRLRSLLSLAGFSSLQ